MERWLKIGCNNVIEFVDLPPSVEDSYPDVPFLDSVHKELRCDGIEIVHLPGLRSFFPGNPIIIIDGAGKLKESHVVNSLCSLFYAPGIDYIAGDALLGMQLGCDVVPFPDSSYHRFINFIDSAFSDIRFKKPAPQGEGEKE